MMKAKIVVLKCITNLHVGNGDVNYNIVDNEVERDPVTKFPTINASGVKGALREFFKDEVKFVKEVFGSDEKANTTQGKIKFLTANMLSMPARASKGESAYYLLTTQSAITAFEDFCKTFLGHSASFGDKHEEENAAAEGNDLHTSLTLSLQKIQWQFYIMPEQDFNNIPLPVMARNNLENGISTNLWYEEIVPHKSMFYFPIVCSDNDEVLLNELAKRIDGKILQFGGNASIGYGLCKAYVLE